MSSEGPQEASVPTIYHGTPLEELAKHLAGSKCPLPANLEEGALQTFAYLWEYQRSKTTQSEFNKDLKRAQKRYKAGLFVSHDDLEKQMKKW